MKRLLALLTCCLAVVGHSQQIKISQYPNTNSLGSNLLFVVADPGKTNYNISYGQLNLNNVTTWGARGDGVTDDTVAFQNCINFNAVETKADVLIPAGVFRIKGSLDLTAKTRIQIHGVGLESILLGGSNGYPIMDFSGSTDCKVESLVITSIGTGTIPSCGILMGRTNVSSAGGHMLKDVWVYGNYSVAGVYTLASEVNQFINCRFTGGGEATSPRACFYSAKNTNNIYSTPLVSLYQTLRDNGSGGNSLNCFIGCAFNMQNGTNNGSIPLIDEYFLGHSFDNCFFGVNGPTNTIRVGKSGVGMSFVACRQETSGANPSGIYASDALVYKDISFLSSHFFPLTGIAGSTFANWSFNSSYWNGTDGIGTRVVDADIMTDCLFHEGTTPPDMGNFVSDGKYRVRTTGSRNRFDNVSYNRLETAATDYLNVSGTGNFGNAFATNAAVGTNALSETFSVRGPSQFMNADINGAFQTTIYLAHQDFPSTFRNKISTSASGDPKLQQILFSCASGASTFTNVMLIEGDGRVYINPLGTPPVAAAAALDVNGDIRASSTVSATNGVASFIHNKAAPSAISVTASVFHYTNTTAVNIQVWIDANGATDTVAFNGTTIFTSLAGADHTVILQPGDWIDLTYSVATPIMKYREF